MNCGGEVGVDKLNIDLLSKMATLQRKLSVHFYQNFLKGVDHGDVLNGWKM